MTAALLASLALAAPPADPPPQMAETLRTLLLANLPTPLVEAPHNWGHQKDATVGVTWHGLKPERRRAVRNDGVWQKLRVEAIEPHHTLALGLRDLRSPTPETTTFVAHAGLDVRLVYEQQVWKSGVRLFAGETRARCRAAAVLDCELTSRLDAKPGAVLPDVVLRLRVTDAKLYYANLVFEHLPGVDGAIARNLGAAGHKFVTKTVPTLEQSLLASANAAVVKAADTKEVRVELAKLVTLRR